MKVHIVQNGNIKIILAGDTEIEKLQIMELFKQPVEVQTVDKIQILDKSITDCVIIYPKTTQV